MAKAPDGDIVYVADPAGDRDLFISLRTGGAVFDDPDLTGGAGPDELAGEAGDDTIESRDGAADSDLCGAGVDTARADGNDTRVACERPVAGGSAGGGGGNGGGNDAGAGHAARGLALVGARRLHITRHGDIRLKLRCLGVTRCRGAVALKAKMHGDVRRVGRHGFRVAKGRTATVRVHLRRAARRRISAGRLRVRATAALRGGAPVGRRLTVLPRTSRR